MTPQQKQTLEEEYGTGYWEALRRIDACRERGDGMLDLSGKWPKYFDLKKLPEEALALALKTLDLGYTRVDDTLSMSLKHLTDLQTLILSRTQVGDGLSEGLKHLTALQELNLSRTQVGDGLSEGLKHLTALQELNLSLTQVGDGLSEGLKHLTALQELNLNNTQVGDGLSEGLKHLTALQTLNLNNTQVGDGLSEGLKHLTALQELYLGDTQVGDGLSEGLKHLTALQTLDLSYTQVVDGLSEGLKHLTALQTLDLTRTQVGDGLSEGLKHLTALQTLNLISTQVGDGLSEGLKYLTALQTLYLVDTQVGNGLSEGLKHLTALQTLYLSGTQVDDGLSDGLKHLTALQTLNLVDTQVGDGLSEGLKHLTALQTLDLSKTQIKNGIQLTNILLSLPALKEVDTQGIKFQDIPNQIHGLNWKFNSLPNLRAWVTDLEKGTHKNRTHKLQIVGNGTVGKTTIANRLLTGTYREPDQSTDGIQVRFSPPQDYLRTNDPINLIVWDFAGQDIYHQMHRQFLRSESVVLLVYDEESINQSTQADRKTGQADLNRSLSYWAQDIMATSPDSEVFLVQNKMDRPGAQAVNVENYLPKDFNYRGPYKISARAGGRPFDRLLEDIHDHITGTKDYKMAIPHSWHLVRQNLLDRTADDSRTTLSVANFSTLCAASKLSANSESALLTYLDGLGIIIYDAELFPDELVLNPQWALDGVYSALQRPDISNIATQTPDQLRHNLALIAFDAEVKKNNGQYLPTQLPFNHSIYDPAARTLFHQIMRRAGTCFQTNDKQDGTPVYVLFHSLPTEETAAAKNAWNNCCSPYATVLFQRYHHPYHLHRGIFRQLVKQINDHVQLDHLWQDGLFLNYQNETFARLTTNYDQNANYIEVAATGPSAAAALQAFRNQLNQIITAEETFQLQVSTNATTWFPLANIDEGRQAEARAIKDTTGTYQKGWEPLAVWALASKPEITFKELPQVAHAAHDTLIASPTETALPLDLDQITATFLQRIEELQASNPGTQITLNVNVGDHYDNRAATMRNLVAGAKVNGSVNFVSPNEEIPS